MLTDPSFATSLVVTALFIVIVVPTQSVLGLTASDVGPRTAGQWVIPHAVRAALDLRAGGDRRAVAVAGIG